MFGGYKNFGHGTSLSKTFSNLPSHFKVLLSFTVIKIDTWDNETFSLEADS